MPDSSKIKLFAPGALLLAALFLAWQLPGIIGREPWKSDEAYTMGLVHHIIESGDVVVPELGGEPFMQKPPVFFVVAAAFAKILSPIFEHHDGARAACLLFNLITLIFVGLAARELNGPGKGWPAAVLFLACIGPIHMAHFILTDLALLTGMAIGLYGMAIGLRREWAGGLLCGTGAGLAFMAKGLVGPGMLGLTVLLLPLVDKAWRTKSWWKFTAGCVLASVPWCSIWPIALYLRSPALFHEWIWDNNFGRFLGANKLGPEARPFYYFKLMPWYAFPATLLIVWTFKRERLAGWASTTLRLPAILFLVSFTVLCISRDGREIYALPLMAPLLVLSSRRLDDISPALARGANTVIFGFFSLVALLLWLVWMGIQMHQPAALMIKLHEFLPGYEPAFEVLVFVFALIASLAWIALVIRHQSDPRHLCAHAAAGVTLLYLLAMTIYLPMADWNMSYRRQLAQLRDHKFLPENAVVASRGLGEPQRAMLEYYAGLKTVRLDLKRNRNFKSDWLLIQSEYDPQTKAITYKVPPGDEWEKVWQEPHNKEIFQLFRKINPR